MKSLLTFLFVFTGTLTLSAQSIPNSGFESWTPYGSGENPNSWNTSDSVTVLYQGGNSAYSRTDSYEGSKCLHLKSTQITYIVLQLTGPGIATNGTMSLVGASFQFTGGSPDTARSRFFTGYYKYTKNGPDEVASVKVYLLRNNAGNRDTVATGVSLFSNDVSTYSQFVTQMDYRDFINRPDTCLIIIQSSKSINDPSIVPGTELVIDSLGFSGFVGLDELSNFINDAKVYPSPADKALNIDVELKKEAELNYEIYDLNGRLISQSQMHSAKEKVDVSALANGRYILKLTDVKRNSLYSAIFTIGR